MTDTKHLTKADRDVVDTITSRLLDAVEGRPVDYVIPVISSFLSLLLYHTCGSHKGAEYLVKVADGMVEDEDEIKLATEELFKGVANAKSSTEMH